jgi:hypothetical protein
VRADSVIAGAQAEARRVAAAISSPLPEPP